MKYFVIVIVLNFYSCGISKYQNSELENDPKSFLTKKGKSYIVDSTFHQEYECNSNRSGKLTQEGFKMPIYEMNYFIDGCIKSKAFMGNQDCIIFIENYLSSITAKEFDLIEKRFRGKRLFQKLLDITSSYELCNDGPDTIIEATAADRPMRALKEMIKSIDGLPRKKYIEQNYFIEALETNLCDPIKVIKLELVPIMMAWDEGKIVLKDFGEN